ncbi:MAG: hypothetical protein RL745_875 [Actinomycetota bacterium]|jgi:exodeoxyribonuclease-3
MSKPAGKRGSRRAGLAVITANVNGIRAAARRGGLDWLHQADADVICLQEVRATHEQLHEVLSASPLRDLHVFHDPAPSLGRAGVAVLSKYPFTATRNSVRHVPLDRSGRWIEADIDSGVGPLTIVSTYVHAGEVGTTRQDEKYAFLAAMDKRVKSLATKAAKGERQVLVCGDFNIAHKEIDIKNWRANRENAGFLPDERAYLDRWFASAHWDDLGRRFGGPGPGPYTWWSWRGRGFDTDGGWRIDYVMASAAIAGLATGVEVGKAPSYTERWSDHAPVTATFAAPSRR